jgi:stearoyl-CoA desaturase (delta-9 desaturase)
MRHGQSNLDNHILFVIQILSYLSVPVMVAYATPANWLICAVMCYLVYHVGVAVTFHRLLTHGSFTTGPVTKVVLTFLGTVATNGSSLYWVALHTTHHKYSDSERDVHSPRFGFWKTWFMPMYPHSPVDSTKLAIRLAKEPLQLLLHKYYWFVIATYVAILYYIDPFSLVYAYLMPVMFSWAMSAGIVNTLCHNKGYRNHDTKDNSRNIRWFSWITNGESYHNNHHAKPSNPNFGSSTEYDPGYSFIKLLVKLNLARLK